MSTSMRKKSILKRLCWMVLLPVVVVVSSNDIMLVDKEDGDPRPNRRPNEITRKRRRFPDTRHLAQLVQDDAVENRMQVKLAPVVAPPAPRPNKNNNNNTKVLCEEKDYNARALQHANERAQRLLEQLDGLCTAVKPSFRLSGGRFQPDHIQFGLQYYFDFECPPPSSPEPSSTTTNTSSTTASHENIFNEKFHAPPSKKGQNTLAAIHRVGNIMRREHQVKKNYEQKKKAGGGNKNDGNDEDELKNLIDVELVDAQHSVETKEFLGPVEEEPEINQHDHPELWARHLRQVERHNRRKLQEYDDGVIPNDEIWINGYQRHYSAIELEEAWSFMKNHSGWKQPRQTRVHVVDTGMDFKHPDLGSNKWRNRKEICGNGIDDDDNGYTDDCYGYNHVYDKGNKELLGYGYHGSHVSGTIAANTNNRKRGVAGVAGGAGGGIGIAMMTSAVFGKNWNYGFEDAYVYAGDHRAHISSSSWGYIKPNVIDLSLEAAIKYANRKGVLLVFAAGNNGSNETFYPAAMPQVLAVSAVHNNGRRTSFTNYGDWVDIAAPGSNVASTLDMSPASNGLLYGLLSGTSMACPHVAGVLAMGKNLFRKATKNDLRRCILRSTDRIGDKELGRGMVNAVRFLKCLRALFAT